MSAITKLIDRIRQAKADLIANREAEVLRIALDQLALTKLRIQTKGQAYTGTAFPPYVPQYAKSRGKAGYQTQYVDFTRTGQLWANIAPVVVDSNVFSATLHVPPVSSDVRRRVLTQHRNFSSKENVNSLCFGPP